MECPFFFFLYLGTVSVKKLVNFDFSMLTSEAQKNKVEKRLTVLEAEDF